MWNTVDGKHNLFGNGSILFFFRVFNTASELFWTRVVTQFFCHTVYTHLFGSNFLIITLVCLRYPLCSVACCCHFSVLLDMFLPFETAENNCRRNRGKALWSELFEPENNELSCCEVFFFFFLFDERSWVIFKIMIHSHNAISPFETTWQNMTFVRIHLFICSLYMNSYFCLSFCSLMAVLVYEILN